MIKYANSKERLQFDIYANDNGMNHYLGDCEVGEDIGITLDVVSECGDAYFGFVIEKNVCVCIAVISKVPMNKRIRRDAWSAFLLMINVVDAVDITMDVDSPAYGMAKKFFKRIGGEVIDGRCSWKRSCVFF